MRIALLALSASAMFLTSTAFAAGNFVSSTEIGTAKTTSGGITFTYGGGEGQAQQTVTIAGAAGSDCLRMWMFIEAYTKGSSNSFGPAMTIDVQNKSCSMQIRPMGA